MREQSFTHGGFVERGTLLLESGEAHDDPRSAEPALAGTGITESLGPRLTERRCEPLDGRHLAPGDPAYGGDACHTGCPVHPHRAAAALSLGAATVLHRSVPELFAQDVEERRAAVCYTHVLAVDDE
jgi:hypothetical protein